MPIYSVIGEDHDCDIYGTVTTNTTPGNYRSFARSALVAGTTSNYVGGKLSAPIGAAEFWASCVVKASTANTSSAFISFPQPIFLMQDGGNARISVDISTGGGLQIAHYPVAARVILATGGPALQSEGSPTKIDIRVVGFGTAVLQIDVYVRGVLYVTYTGAAAMGGSTQLTYVLWGRYFTSLLVPAWFSEMWVASFDTRNLAVVTAPLLAQGNINQWTGTVADVSEVTLSDSTLQTAAAPALRTQWTIDPVRLTTQLAVRAVVLTDRSSRGLVGPTQLSSGLRMGGVNYDLPNTLAPAALAQRLAVWELSPATSAAWTRAEVVAAGFNAGLLTAA